MMFGLSRLLELAERITWWLERRTSSVGQTWRFAQTRANRNVCPTGKKRRAALRLEELEDRTVPTLLGQQLFPADYPWNQNIASAPVAANSAAIMAHMG